MFRKKFRGTMHVFNMPDYVACFVARPSTTTQPEDADDAAEEVEDAQTAEEIPLNTLHGGLI